MTNILKNIRLLNREQRYLKNNYPSLKLRINSQVEIVGLLEFSAAYNEEIISNRYNIKIILPPDYPKMVPMVWELDNRIDKNYHKYDDGSLCLGTPTDIYLRFMENPNIGHFIKDLVIPYLYRYSYIKKYKENPFPDYSHGTKGIIEYYLEFFSTDTISTVLDLLKTSINSFNKEDNCPCGSPNKINNCHKIQLEKLIEIPKGLLMLHYGSLEQHLNTLMESIRIKSKNGNR